VPPMLPEPKILVPPMLPEPEILVPPMLPEPEILVPPMLDGFEQRDGYLFAYTHMLNFMKFRNIEFQKLTLFFA
jgi:hypothetical protein